MSDDNDSIKRPRSIQYPYYSLKESIDFATIVQKVGGNGIAPYESIITGLGITTVNNNRFTYLNSSSEYFGLTLRGDKGVKITQLGFEIIFPVDSTQNIQNLKKACSNPKLYQSLISQYENCQLPNEEILINTFIRYGIVSTRAKNAVNAFIDSLKIAGILNNENKVILSQNQNVTKTTEVKSENSVFTQRKDEIPIVSTEETKKENPVNKPLVNQDFQKPISPNIEFKFPLDSDQIVFLSFPSDTSADDLSTIKELIVVLLDKRIEKKNREIQKNVQKDH